MPFKKLTNKGKIFIRTVCDGTSDSLISGKQNYRLPFSELPVGTIFTSNSTDNLGNTIITNEQLGEALIFWFDFYSEQFELDANIIAAQTYIESNYRLWAYAGGNSSAQGISQFLSSSLYDVAIGNFGVASFISTRFTENEILTLINGLERGREQKAYLYKNNASLLNIALSNRVPFFQNVIDNPQLSIKAQCRYMKGLSINAADNAASTLFGYNQGQKFVKSTYTDTVLNAKNGLSETRLEDGLNYVNRIFRVLGDDTNNLPFKPNNVSFGYPIDFDFDTFTADVKSSGTDIDTIDRSTKLSKDYTLGDLLVTDQGTLNIPNKNEFNRLKLLVENVLQPITDLIGKKLIINSAFRSEVTNSSVGGVVSSQHRLGEAADIRVDSNTLSELFDIYEKIIASNIPYDQIIFETKGDSILQRWIHISYKQNNNRFEKLIATLVDGSMEYEIFTG